MTQDTIAMFDQQAATYDETWRSLAPLREALQLVLDAAFAALPAGASVLCVGAGTGAEILPLAQRHPGWRFTAVDPSGAMLDVLRAKAEAQGIASRCTFHHGYLASLPMSTPFDGATSILVSQFVTDPVARQGFFLDMARRLRPGGHLVSADLACDMTSASGSRLLELWFELMSVSPEARERARSIYGEQVAVVPPESVEALIAAGGFETPIRCFQSGLIHAWFTRATRGD
ncbi:class I SAM-dependent methyltransferase [Pandoraea pulmonicola]|uniref:SAM-dependent methyltransferase n=1 Tax=Pandoraea pulmonicola TaxID=93221 RepID=A0AAJ4ZHC1_PANPU|nr:class I SAM-dependent methyltransferase [Pandoraea pulmonicola]AJC22439.1 SAM-dependent methyltransferase [Pandoraea pulmonicola]SUA93432.1 Trans-aconitate methyltransferase [Pandoraea pulmonicola]